jgi:hypothetical protein
MRKRRCAAILGHRGCNDDGAHRPADHCYGRRMCRKGRPHAGVDFSEGHLAVGATEGIVTLKAMGNHRHDQGNKLILEPPIAASEEHARLVEAGLHFQAALGQAIATPKRGASRGDRRSSRLSALQDSP